MNSLDPAFPVTHSHSRLRFVIGAVLAATVALLVSIAVNSQTSVAGQAPLMSYPLGPAAPGQANGAQLYSERCASCHQPGGEGVPGSFPPLAGNPAAADADYVDEVIRNGLSGPIEVLGAAYDAVMPPVDMGDDERAVLIDHVVGLAGTDTVSGDAAGDEETTATSAVAVVGDIEQGRELFVGSKRFANGGGACAGCHEAGDVGHLGGGSLGPDLDETFQTLGGEAGLSAWLANPASATMQPIFTDDPLTEEEVADVVAFLETAPDRDRPSGVGDSLLVGGLLGLAILLAGMAFFRQGMSQSYAQRLRSKR